MTLPPAPIVLGEATPLLGDHRRPGDDRSMPQKNLRNKRLQAARMQWWACMNRPSTLKVTSLKTRPLMRKLR
ncbi:hypothetical protein B296_00014849 [Ensete ventricosum]|uniref:Uncharacterized protein n=1 Tax=Ensete ventricosum TaxID=4639 RepID=A0A426YDL4_ENSVE|nr:hypothetical protein B296_00014849 [Ensete ventricosum]